MCVKIAEMRGVFRCRNMVETRCIASLRPKSEITPPKSKNTEGSCDVIILPNYFGLRLQKKITQDANILISNNLGHFFDTFNRIKF